MGQSSLYKLVVQILKALCIPYKDPCSGEEVNPFPGGAGTFKCEQLAGCDEEICELVKANCSDSLVDDGCSSFTHTAINGDVVSITHTPSLITDVGTGRPRQNIATHANGCDVPKDIQESITESSVNGNTLTIIHENNSTTVYTPEEKSIISSDGTIVITDNGLECDLSSPKSIFTDLNPTGQLIGNHNDGTGIIVPVNETVTNSVASNTTLTITHEDDSQTVFTPDNTQNTVTSNDNSVIIVESPNADGEINYDLAVTPFDDTEIQCKLDLLCNAFVTVMDCYRVGPITSPTNTFTIPALGADETFVDVCYVDVTGSTVFNLEDRYGFDLNGQTVTTTEMYGEPNNPCIVTIFYKKQVKLINCTSC